MICPKCHFEQAQGLSECPKCGVVYAKLNKSFSTAPAPVPKTPSRVEPDKLTWKDLLITVPNEANPVFLVAKATLLVILAVWGSRFMFASVESNVVGESVLHLVNLIFHEAGHIIFSPFGQFIKTLGGTLGQLLMPAICAAVLLVNTRDAFGAAVAFWWLAQSFMDIAPYINDARALKLILLGGVTGKDVIDYQDWEYILRKLGLLKMDHFLAWCAQITGIVLMLTALAWAALNIWAEWRSYRKQPEAST